MRLVRLTEIPDDASLREQWNTLVSRMDEPQVFYTWEWAFAVQQAYGSRLCPLVFLAYDEHETLCGVAALATDPAGKRGSFLSATTGDYCDVISAPEYRDSLVSGVLAELRKQNIDALVFTNLPADSETVAALEKASKQNQYYCFMRTAYDCAQVVFERLERGRDGKPVAPGKKRVRRFAKAMVSEGRLEVQHHRSWDGVAPILPQFLRAHVARFLEIGRISNLADPLRRAFLSELTKVLSRPGWLVLSRMTIGERPVAWHYGFQFHHTWFWYQPTFDSSVEKHWPGFCLLTEVIEDATEIPGITNLDLGLGSEAYKAKFANASRRTLYAMLHRSLVKHWMEIGRYRTALAFAAHPHIEERVRKWVARTNDVKRLFRKSGVRGTLRRLLSRVGAGTAVRNEVFFFEAPAGASKDTSATLLPLTFGLLAEGAMRFCDHEETLPYVLRAADRLREGSAEGFVLVKKDDPTGPLHFAWIKDFERIFLTELNARVPAPTPNSVMIFDCWTPPAFRGHRYYGLALRLIVEQMRARGKRPWIFSAARNRSSIRGLEDAGFHVRYSLTRRRLLVWQWIQGTTPTLVETPPVEVSAHV
ncbi:MAG TPA: GNAT family N-acetyltransferase [Verrucomicrobiae bacterium]|nr:GNAT family N-acetyltransferase [Verrucomicrobiae bacterium]